MERRWGRRGVAGQKSDYRAGPMQMLLYRGGPMDLGVKQAFQPRPIAALDRGEHIADRGYLLRHDYGTRRGLAMQPPGS